MAKHSSKNIEFNTLLRESLRDLMAAQGLTNEDVGVSANCSSAYVSELKSGKKSGTLATWEKIVQVFDMSLENFAAHGKAVLQGVNDSRVRATAPGTTIEVRMEKKDLAPNYKLIGELKGTPLIKDVPQMDYNHEPPALAFHVNALKKHGENARFLAFTVKDDSMCPALQAGDYVLTRRGQPDNDGVMVLARLTDGALAIRRAHKHKKGFLVIPNDPAFPPQEVQADAIYGQVVGVWREMTQQL